jgi:hypothetical protein
VHTAEEFGVEVPDGAYERMATAIDSESEWDELSDKDWFREAQEKARRESFFHWELEFPSVFFDADGEKKDNSGFDVVIGNPPWLDAWRMSEKMPETRDAIANIYEDTALLTGHWDLFVPFVIQGLDLCRDGGEHSYILPNPILREKYAKEIRYEILTNHAIKKILSFGELDVFPKVDRQCLVYVIKKGSDVPDFEDLLKVSSVSPFEYNKIAEMEHRVWEESYNHQIRVTDKFIDAVPVLQKIEDKSKRMGDFFYVNYGAQVSSKNKGKFSKEDVVFESPIEDGKKFFEGGDISRYHREWRGLHLDYRPQEMYGPRSPELFENEKIVVSVRTAKNEELKIAIDEDEHYCDHTVIVCVDYSDVEDTGLRLDFEGFSRKSTSINKWLVLAQLNSKVTNWVFQNKFATGGLQGSYSDVWPDNVRSIPIIPVTELEIPDDNIDVEDMKENQLAGRLSSLAKRMTNLKRKKSQLNLSLLDHLGISTEDELDGPTLTDVGLTQPPVGVADAPVSKTSESEEFHSLRVGRAEVKRESSTEVEIRLTARHKPDPDEKGKEAYTETEPLPTLRITDLNEHEADLIEAFVPVAVDRAGGFAGFRETATKTNSLVDRLRKLTLPRVDEVRDGLESYVETKERADELDEKIEKTDDLIDEIVYDLYGLTDEEIEIVEEAVTND